MPGQLDVCECGREEDMRGYMYIRKKICYYGQIHMYNVGYMTVHAKDKNFWSHTTSVS